MKIDIITEERMYTMLEDFATMLKKEMQAQRQTIIDELSQKILYTREQFAQLLCISTKTLHSWLNEGKLQSQSYFNTGLFTHQDYINILENPLYKIKNKKKKNYDLENMF